MTRQALIDLLARAYAAGFNDSAEGWNGEYPSGATEEPEWLERQAQTATDLATEAAALGLIP